MKVEQFARIIWNRLVIRQDNKNSWRVGDDFVEEWSMHTPEFQFMKIFNMKNHHLLSMNHDEDYTKYNQGKVRVVKFKAYGRYFGFATYCCNNTQFMVITKKDLISLYDYFVDEGQHMKEERYANATPRRPYFMERFNESETFVEWFNDPSRSHKEMSK